MRRPASIRPAARSALSAAPLTPVAALPLRAVVHVQTAVSERLRGRDPEAGMTTAEYAVGTVAACGFSGILYKVITSDQVLDILKGVISRAFKLSF